MLCPACHRTFHASTSSPRRIWSVGWEISGRENPFATPPPPIPSPRGRPIRNRFSIFVAETEHWRIEPCGGCPADPTRKWAKSRKLNFLFEKLEKTEVF